MFDFVSLSAFFCHFNYPYPFVSYHCRETFSTKSVLKILNCFTQNEKGEVEMAKTTVEDYIGLAKDIVRLVGGTDNIRNVQNCMTRLRLTLADDSLAKTEDIKALDGIMGVAVQGGQYQIIIGQKVAKVAEAVRSVTGFTDSESAPVEQASGSKEKVTPRSVFNAIFKTISGSIFPFIYILMAGGICAGIATIINTAIGGDAESPWYGTYAVFQCIYQGVMYFLPLFIGYNAAKKLNCNPDISMAIAGAMIFLTTAGIGGVTGGLGFSNVTLQFLGVIPMTVPRAYGGQIFPIIGAVAVQRYVEKFWKKVLPELVENMFTPLLTLIVMVPLTFILIGPVLYYLGVGIGNLVSTLYDTAPILTGIIVGAFWQCVVMFGLHYAMVPILISMIPHVGINGIMGVTVFALAGMCLGFALKVNDREQKALGFSALTSALCGVTEPALYGVGVRNRRVWISTFIGGAIAGLIAGATGLYTTATGANGLFEVTIVITEEPMNLVWWIVASAVSFVVSGVFAYIFAKKDQAVEIA